MLVTGGTGFLGGELVAQVADRGDDVVATWHHAEPTPAAGVRWVQVDLADPVSIVAVLEEMRPRLVVNTAYVESGPDLTSVTAEAPGVIGRWCAATGARFVHVSSDVVHRGECGVTYADNAAPEPMHAYGRAKAEAEGRVRAADPTALVARTSLLVAGPGGPPGRQERLVLDVLDGRSDVTFFDDEVRCPVVVADLAAALLALVATEVAGTVNVAGADAVSRAELARLIAAVHGRDPAAVPTGPTPVHLVDRPRCLVLDSRRAARIAPLRGVGAWIGPDAEDLDRRPWC